MPSPKRKRSRSHGKEEFKYPANSSKELKALILQFMHSEKFVCPLDSLTLMKNLRMQFKTPSGRMMMRNYNINDLLQELEDKKALKIEPFSLGINKCSMIVSVSREVIQQLSRETSKDRPKKFPIPIPDAIEKFSWPISNKNISEYHFKPYRQEPSAFSIKGTCKDLKNSDLILVNLLENKCNLAQISETKGEELQNQGILIFKCEKATVWQDLMEKWGYKVEGVIEVNRIKKYYTKRSLWSLASKEELLVGSKDTECVLPQILDCENDQELYKEILKVFMSTKPVEIFSKVGKDGWIIVDSLI